MKNFLVIFLATIIIIVNSNEEMEGGFQTEYLKDQPQIDFFKQKKFLDKFKVDKTKPFILNEQIKMLKNNEDKYFANHNNKEIFLALIGNATNSDSKDLLQSYENYRKERKPDNNIHTNDWYYDVEKKEYILPSDSSFFI